MKTREEKLARRRAYYLKTAARRRLLSSEEQKRNRYRPGRIASRKKWFSEHREQVNASGKAWVKRNPAYHQKWAALNPDKAKEYHEKWKAGVDKDRLKAMRRASYLRRKDKQAIWAKAYRKKNKGKISVTAKAWVKRNQDKVRATSRRNRHLTARWRKEHPEKVRELSNRRRARKAAAGCQDCSAKIEALSHNRFCHYCCTPLTKENRTVDHVTPLARGGLHIPDNLVAACKTCNSSKGKKCISEWTWEMAA